MKRSDKILGCDKKYITCAEFELDSDCRFATMVFVTTIHEAANVRICKNHRRTALLYELVYLVLCKNS